MAGRCSARDRRQRGSVSAELVIATPLLLLLILGVIQFALWQHASHVAKAAAQQGLAVGRLEDGSETSGRDQATAVLIQLGVLSDSHVEMHRTADTTTITVTGDAPSVLPFFHLPVRAVATGPTERFRSEAAGP